MHNRILSLPLAGPHSIFLIGARGTGKSTWVEKQIPERLVIDLQDYKTFVYLLADATRLEGLIPSLYTGWVVIEEIQRMPALLEVVDTLISLKKYRFLLTASSRHALRKKSATLLAGKTLIYHMHPLIIQEIEQEFHLKRVLKDGLLPAVAYPDGEDGYFANYIREYINEEVVQAGLTRNISGFTLFLERASAAQGAVINISELARELSLNRLMVARYYDILEDLLLGVKITPFTYQTQRKIIAHSKFYFFDTGIYNALRSMGPIKHEGEMAGAALRTLFLQSARAINDYYSLGYKIHFWQTFAGLEVPFVLHGPRGLHAFALTSSPMVTHKTGKALRAFKKDYPSAITHILHTGSTRDKQDEHTIIPFVDALKELPLLLDTSRPF